MNNKRVTIVAFNSVGILYEMKTTVRELTESNNVVTVIHKPKGKQQHYKHTYDKDSELKVYEGWINTGINEQSEFVSYGNDNSKVKGNLIFS